jgi:hypothetical protein
MLHHNAMVLALLVLATALLAWRSGGAPERAIAKALLVMAGIDGLREIFTGSQDPATGFDLIHALRDALVLIWLGAIALRANRFYPLAMAATALIAVLAHLLRGAGWLNSNTAYQALITTPSFILLLVFWIGLARHSHRTGKRGPYPDWQN